MEGLVLIASPEAQSFGLDLGAGIHKEESVGLVA